MLESLSAILTQIDPERLLSGEVAGRPDLLKARFQVRGVDAPRPAIDHDQARFALGSGVQQKTIAFARTSHVKAEDQGGPPHTL